MANEIELGSTHKLSNGRFVSLEFGEYEYMEGPNLDEDGVSFQGSMELEMSFGRNSLTGLFTFNQEDVSHPDDYNNWSDHLGSYDLDNEEDIKRFNERYADDKGDFTAEDIKVILAYYHRARDAQEQEAIEHANISFKDDYLEDQYGEPTLFSVKDDSYDDYFVNGETIFVNPNDTWEHLKPSDFAGLTYKQVEELIDQGISKFINERDDAGKTAFDYISNKDSKALFQDYINDGSSLDDEIDEPASSVSVRSFNR